MKRSPLLERHLRKSSLSEDELPQNKDEWRDFLDRIDKAYQESDQRIEILEHSIDLSSRESEVKFNRIAKNIPGIVFELLIRPDDTFDLLYASAGADDIFEAKGLAASLDIARLASMIAPATQLRILRRLKVSARRQRPWKMEWQITTPGHQTKWVQGHARPHLMEVGGTFWVGVIVDITRQKEMEATLESERIQNANSAKMATLGEMAGGIAHEINNPLSIIHLKAQILQTKLKTGKFALDDFLTEIGKIEKIADRIARIIRGLKSFSRNSEADPMESVRVSDIVGDTLEVCRDRFIQSDIELRVDCASEASIECRPAQISQVIMNLLSNAHDAVEKIPIRWVELRVQDMADKVRIEVTDSGQGIPQEIVQRIMQPFFTTKEKGKGTGLGLSISKGITERHNGLLVIDDASQHTRFVLELLRQQPPMDGKVS